MSWFDPLDLAGAPVGLSEWARVQPSLASAWRTCERADWLFWLAAQIARDERERKYVAAAGGSVARRVRRRLLPPLRPTDADLAVLWGTSVPRADVTELLHPLGVIGLAGPTAFAVFVALVYVLRRTELLAWSVALIGGLFVLVAVGALTQRARVRGAAARLRRFDWERAFAGVSCALADRVHWSTRRHRQELVNELRAAIEEPGWLRLV